MPSLLDPTQQQPGLAPVPWQGMARQTPGNTGGGALPAPPQVPGLPAPAQRARTGKQNSVRYVDYTVRLSRDERMRFGGYLRQEIDTYNAAVDQRRTNAEQWRDDFEIMPQAQDDERWENAAAVTSPFTHIYVKSHQTRLNGQIGQQNPRFSVVAKRQEAIDAAPMIEEAISSVLDEMMWDAVAMEMHSELPLMGNAFLRTTYEEEWRRRPTTQCEWNEDVFYGLVEAGVPADQAFLAAVERYDDGTPIITLAHENHLKSSGPKMRVIPWEDGVIFPAYIRDPKEARGIGERFMIRGSELKQGAKAKKYFKDAVEELLKQPSDQLPADRARRMEQQGLDGDMETEPADSDDHPLFRDYLVYEMCVQYDANHDGEDEWCIATLHYETGTLLRLVYLPFEHGEPYYKLFRYITRTGELLGIGIAELLAGLQDAHTAVLCQIIDAADYALNHRGNFFYDKSSGYDPDKYVADLSQPIPVDHVEGIKEIEIPVLAAEHYQLHQTLKDLADLVTASSNPSLGRETDANKTLGEVRLVMQASEQIFGEIAGGVALQWADAMDQVRWLLAQYGQNGEVTFRKSATPGEYLTGPDGQRVPVAMIAGQAQPAQGGVAFGSVPADVLLAEVDIVPTGLKALGDAQSRLQQASMVQQVLLQHPLTMQNSPALFVALDQFLQAAQYGQREKILDEVAQGMQAQALVSAMALKTGADAANAQGDMEGKAAADEANRADQQHEQATAQGNQQMELAARQQQQAENAPPARKPLANP